MSISIRAFLVDSEGVPKRFPYTRFDRLLNGDPGERVPHLAGRDALFALASVELLDRRPTRLLRVDYMRIRMDDSGQVDENERQRGLALALGSVDLMGERDERTNLVRAEHVFLKRQYRHEFSWQPSPEQQAEIEALAVQ